MQRTLLTCLLCLPVLVGACPTRRFEITMQRTSDGEVRRELTIWVDSDGEAKSPAGDMLKQAQQAYSTDGQADGVKRRFSTTVLGTLPQDLVHVGQPNFGLFSSQRTPLGAVHIYAERMPGRVDALERVRQTEALVDLCTTALAAAVRQHPEWATEPKRLDDLVRWLRTELRDDAANVLLLTGGTLERMAVIEDLGLGSRDTETQRQWPSESFRIVSYLIQRGYVHAHDAWPFNESLLDRLACGVARKAATILGHAPDGPWPESLRRLSEPETGAEELTKLLEAGLAAEGKTMDDIAALQRQLLPVFEDPTSGTVLFRCEQKPAITNGEWDGTKQGLVWQAQGRTGWEPPQVLYAFWGHADARFQLMHFGRVAVRDQPLLDYTEWYCGLSKAERSTWDAFVEALRPGDELAQRLQAFRFESHAETQPAEDPPRGARLILSGLTP